MSSVQFAVPTYRRAETLASKTYALLTRLGVRDQTTIFLSDPSERREYAARLPGARFVDGALGVGPNRNVIHHYYQLGTRVVSIDDDVRDVLGRRNEKTLEPLDADGFAELVENGFLAAQGGLWGIYPVPNAYFQRLTVSHDLRYIAAGLYGFTTRETTTLDVTLEDKEDFERSILYYLADGYVTRLNWYSLRTAGYHGAGGMQVTRTPERVNASARRLAARYPDLAHLNLSKKSGWAEVRLRDARPQPAPR